MKTVPRRRAGWWLGMVGRRLAKAGQRRQDSSRSTRRMRMIEKQRAVVEG